MMLLDDSEEMVYRWVLVRVVTEMEGSKSEGSRPKNRRRQLFAGLKALGKGEFSRFPHVLFWCSWPHRPNEPVC